MTARLVPGVFASMQIVGAFSRDARHVDEAPSIVTLREELNWRSVAGRVDNEEEEEENEEENERNDSGSATSDTLRVIISGTCGGEGRHTPASIMTTPPASTRSRARCRFGVSSGTQIVARICTRNDVPSE